MKYLGVDFGTKRIGIAISDEDGGFAFPWGIIDADAQSVAVLVDLIQKETIGGIVIGESLASNGEPNTLVQLAIRFKEKLALNTAVPVHFEREGFSTVEAHRYQVKKGSRDDSAAAIILQRFLDKQPK